MWALRLFGASSATDRTLYDIHKVYLSVYFDFRGEGGLAGKRKRIGDLLLEAGVIDEQQLQQALILQKELNMRLGDVLILQKYITEQQLVEVLEFQFGIRHVELYRQTIEAKAINLIPQRFAEQHQVLPISIEGSKLIVATADPLDYIAIDELRLLTGMRVEPVMAYKEELLRFIKRYYGLQETLDQISTHLNMPEDEARAKLRAAAESGEDDSPVVKTVNQIILQAIQIGASDIHFDPQGDQLRIRYRVDGVMRTERSLPAQMQSVIVARAKIMAGLNVAERRLPQDGRIQVEVERRKVDLRISTLPTVFGEKVVMRILDLSVTLTEVDRLGLSEANKERFLRGIQSSHGAVFITGPTGSGKTTTLYSALNRLNQDDVNIITIEDPVEFQLANVNQLQVNPQIELTFALGLRAILRQDPNIVMVGEIRDTETAEIAIRAAITGHLMLSTLHSNNAVNAISRLIDMGIEPYLVASSVSCIVAQRLVRTVCHRCAEAYSTTKTEAELLDSYGIKAARPMKGQGCGHCGRTGYKGRMAIHEVLLVDDEIRSMIVQKRPDSDYMRHAMQHGDFVPMIVDGLQKMADGHTTISEVLRVTSR
jgi:type IV pilus assembly protein PilB